MDEERKNFIKETLNRINEYESSSGTIQERGIFLRLKSIFQNVLIQIDCQEKGVTWHVTKKH